MFNQTVPNIFSLLNNGPSLIKRQPVNKKEKILNYDNEIIQEPLKTNYLSKCKLQSFY